MEGTNDLIAYCGLYCGDCIQFESRASELAKALVEELEKIDYANYADAKNACAGNSKVIGGSELQYYQEFAKVLNVIAVQGCKRPCRLGGDGCGEACDIKKCVISKDFAGCWECGEFDTCEKFEHLAPIVGDIRVNLRDIKKYGPEEWIGKRQAFYPWQR